MKRFLCGPIVLTAALGFGACSQSHESNADREVKALHSAQRWAQGPQCNGYAALEAKRNAPDEVVAKCAPNTPLAHITTKP